MLSYCTEPHCCRADLLPSGGWSENCSIQQINVLTWWQLLNFAFVVVVSGQIRSRPAVLLHLYCKTTWIQSHKSCMHQMKYRCHSKLSVLCWWCYLVSSLDLRLRWPLLFSHLSGRTRRSWQTGITLFSHTDSHRIRLRVSNKSSKGWWQQMFHW